MTNLCSTYLSINFFETLNLELEIELSSVINFYFKNTSFSLKECFLANNSQEFLVFLESYDIKNGLDIHVLEELYSHIELFLVENSLDKPEIIYNYEESNNYIYGDQNGKLSIFEYAKLYDDSLFDSLLQDVETLFENHKRNEIFTYIPEVISIQDLLPKKEIKDYLLSDIIKITESPILSVCSSSAFDSGLISFKKSFVSLFKSFKAYFLKNNKNINDKFNNIDKLITIELFANFVDKINMDISDISLNKMKEKTLFNNIEKILKKNKLLI
jgi:hypothetical protein